MIKKTAFKGFDKNLQCRGFQYEVGKKYKHEGDIKLCESGFHACENPFDVWSYYDVYESRYCEVTLSGEQKSDGNDSKIAAAKIKIEAELTLPAFIDKAVNWIIDACKTNVDTNNELNEGYSARIGSSGYSARIGSSGDSARIGSSGDHAQIGSSGDSAQIGSSGYYAQINSEGEKAVIASAGYQTKVKAKKGAWISLAEFNDDGECVGFATGCIGKDGLKEDTEYFAKDRKLVEVEK